MLRSSTFPEGIHRVNTHGHTSPMGEIAAKSLAQFPHSWSVSGRMFRTPRPT